MGTGSSSMTNEAEYWNPYCLFQPRTSVIHFSGSHFPRLNPESESNDPGTHLWFFSPGSGSPQLDLKPERVSPGWWRLGFELVSSPDMAALQDVSWSFHTVWAHRCLRASSWFTVPLVAWSRHTCYVLMRQLLASRMSKQKWTRVLFIHFIPRLFYTVLAA